MRARYNKIDITQEIKRNDTGCRPTTSGSATDTDEERVEGEDAGENILVEEETEESARTMCDGRHGGVSRSSEFAQGLPEEIETTTSPAIRFPELRMDS